jgi:hypothetical protein
MAPPIPNDAVAAAWSSCSPPPKRLSINHSQRKLMRELGNERLWNDCLWCEADLQ